MPEVIFHSGVKYTYEDAYRHWKNDFDLSMCELESFTIIQYFRRPHITHCIFYIETCGNPIFWENMSRIRFIGILRYLNFDDKPKMH